MELADFANESVILYDTGGNALYCNHASAALYGWPPGKNPGRDFNDLLYGGERAPFSWLALLEAGGWTGALRRRARDGGAVVTSVRLNVRFNASGPLDVVEYSAPCEVDPKTAHQARTGLQPQA